MHLILNFNSLAYSLRRDLDVNETYRLLSMIEHGLSEKGYDVKVTTPKLDGHIAEFQDVVEELDRQLETIDDDLFMKYSKAVIQLVSPTLCRIEFL